MTDQNGRAQARGIKITVAALLAFMLIAVSAFVYRVQMPRVMTASELKLNGAYMFDTPRNIGDFTLQSHLGKSFTPADFQGRWTLVFFGFTYCPDICPTTMSFLNEFMGQLAGTEVEDTAVVMISVDPARDTVEQLSSYVPFFNKDFVGVTGEFLEIHRVATALNTPFRKVIVEGGEYQIDHGSNVVLMNPRGDYHGFFKAPLDMAKMKVTYRSIRALWDQ
ncbi:MAG: protein SCO1/2 [Halioglobus sp.]|jgi:protein SCO1/2